MCQRLKRCPHGKPVGYQRHHLILQSKLSVVNISSLLGSRTLNRCHPSNPSTEIHVISNKNVIFFFFFFSCFLNLDRRLVNPRFMLPKIQDPGLQDTSSRILLVRDPFVQLPKSRTSSFPGADPRHQHMTLVIFP